MLHARPSDANGLHVTNAFVGIVAERQFARHTGLETADDLMYADLNQNNGMEWLAINIAFQKGTASRSSQIDMVQGGLEPPKCC